ncbi:DUF2267 domain-containing protein [Lujinxingia litoralis]|nr:DUF2267 domain-containing protein [Lujinxingia litoralis]
MNHDVFFMRVGHRTGIADEAMVAELIETVLRELGGALSAHAAREVSERLPEPLAGWLRERPDEKIGPGAPPTALYRQVGRALELEPGFAVEFTEVVCQVLGESLGREPRARLGEALGEGWEELFEPRAADVGQRPELAEEPGVIDRTTRDDMACGEPGSEHPLATSSGAQQDSIAATDSPHQGDRLATSQGKPARRTLAEGKPGSSRSLNEPHR